MELSLMVDVQAANSEHKLCEAMTKPQLIRLHESMQQSDSNTTKRPDPPCEDERDKGSGLMPGD
jgi:hypothetical protein